MKGPTITDPVAFRPPDPPRVMPMTDNKRTDNSSSNAKCDVNDDAGGSAIRLRRCEGLEQSCIR